MVIEVNRGLLLKLANTLQLGYAIDHACNGRSEFLLYIVQRDIGVLDDIMQHGRGQGLVIKMQAIKDVGHGEDVTVVGLTGGALLVPVCRDRPTGGRLQQLLL